MGKFLLTLCFIFCIASASTCLERIIYADEIATAEVQFNYIRFLVSPCTFLCGCDQNPAAVGVQLLQSVALNICCQAGSRAACCWRVLAKWIYEATNERFQRLELNDDCFTCVFVSTCCLPISLAFILLCTFRYGRSWYESSYSSASPSQLQYFVLCVQQYEQD